MQNLTHIQDVKMYIESFLQPQGLNAYAWENTKRTAMEVWECHLKNRPVRRNLNFLCKEFYQMIRKPNGDYIVPRSSFRTM
jgi:hypothetical protein